MTIDFNKEPYFNDYDEDKGFYKILFRPGFAVQTRELNQLQSILQKQVERFGNNIFREGSIVLGGAFDLQSKASYVRLDDVDTSVTPLSEFIGKEIVGSDSDLRAYVLTAEFDTEDNVAVLFVRYLNSNDIDETVFRADETLTVESSSITVTTTATDPTGEGSIFTIDEGVTFVRGYFVQFPRQTIVLDKYSTTPTLSIVFRVQDPNIVDSNDDPSLLDNAQGTFNFTAPGADRLLLSLTIETAEFGTAGDNPDLNLLADVEEGLISESNERTEYARIYDEIAKRTSDESGDYYVRGMTVRTREALDIGENEGLDPAGDPDKLSIDIEPGLAYVKGYEINNRTTHHELIDKGIDFKFVNNGVVSARTGGFVVVNEIVGSFNIDEGTAVNLYDAAEQRVTNDTNVGATPTGNLIGTARVKTVAYNSGDLGTPEGSLQLYLFDINMDGTNVISDVLAIQTTGFFSDLSEPLSENIDNTLIYRLGTESTRKIRSDTQLENTTDTSYSFYTTRESTIPQNTNTISVTSPEPLAYSIGTLSQLERREIFVSIDSAVGSPNNYPAGQHLDLSDPSVVVNVTSTTTFTIDLGDTFDILDPSSSTPVTVSYKARRSAIFESAKTLVPDVYVKIGFDQANAPDLDGPIPLGISDVYRISKIYRLPSDGGSDPFTAEEGTDVTDSFAFNNGQSDNYYDHATIQPVNITLNSDDWLLVKLDYFSSDTHSYFSVDSYPINDSVEQSNTIFTYQIPSYITSFGEEYNLRDCLDFRPVKELTAAEADEVSLASVNPAITDDFIGNQTTDKLLIPLPSSRVNLDYSHYLARRDVLTLDRKGNFSTIRGTPSTTPVTPSISENVMGIANIFIPPYPSTSQTFARILGIKDEFCTHERIAHKRYTMRDIGVLQDRIENLEYYNVLNLLEKETADLQILDENGNDRFKNGFLADGFLDHSLGDTTNPDYNIAVDKIEQVIRPVFEMDAFNFEFDESTSNLVKIGNLVHLPVESEEVLVSQTNATTTRNVEQSVYRFLGNLELDPDNDTWVDDTVVDKNIEFGNNLDLDKVMTTEWGSWEKHIVGYDVSKQRGGWTGLKFRAGSKNSTSQHVGSYSSYAAAVAAARSQASYSNFQGGYRNGVLEKIQEEQRNGIQTTVTYEKETQELGNFITDVSVVPYIRPQAINFYASGIKPRTRHFFFFDGEDVTQYVRQYTDVGNPTTFTAEGSELRSNEFGEIRGVLYLPTSGKRFRTGTKEVVISDNLNDSLEDITSRAENYFIASGLNVQKQNTTLSTKVATNATSEEVFETRNKSAVDTKVVGPSCIAYTFRVDAPPEAEGVFVTSTDLFFEQFHPELGFRVQIRELNSGGNITQEVLPYSEVWVDRKIRDSQGNRIDNPILQTSDDGTAPTNVEFKAPVFLYNETSYAIVISAENINPDTYLWISRIGQTDVATQQAVTSRRLTGAIYTTNNSVNWDIVPQADLKFKLYRAKFETDVDRTGILKNRPYEFFNLTNVPNTYTNIGETINGSDRITVSLASGTISDGDDVTGQTSNVAGVVVPNGYDGISVKTTGFGFEVGEPVIFSSGGTTTAEGTITAIASGSATLAKFDPTTNEMKLSNSNGQFFENGLIEGANSDITSTIDSYYEYKYSSTTLKPDFLSFQETICNFEKRGRRSSDNAFGSYIDGDEDGTSSFDEEYQILSRSKEVELFGESGFSSNARVTMSTTSEYLSPVVDMSRANSVYIHNLVNADVSGEDEPSNGNLTNKYISKVITLDDGQDAEDLNVFLSAYRPPSKTSVENDIRVWMRVKHAEDPAPFSTRPWMEMISNNDTFSSSDNEFDFIAISYNVDPENLNGSDIVSYDTTVDSSPITFSTFKQYQIKIGIVGGNSAIVPKIGDFRAIALQK